MARRLMDVAAIEEVEACFEDLLAVRLPLPFPGPPERARFSVPGPADAPSESGLPLMVVFLQFALGTNVVAEPQDIRANVLYDLNTEIRLSRWPAGVKAIEVSPFSVEPHGAIEAPTFVIEKNDGKDLSFSRTGRLCVRLAHDALARPLEISYGVHPVPVEASESRNLPKVEVQGQRRLLLRCEEHGHLWQGNKAVEGAVLRVREEARRHGLPDEELTSFLTLLSAVGLVAAENLASNIYPGQWSEKEFQDSMKARLRANGSIGSDLEEHAHIAGGVTDLSFHRVRLELKVDPRPIDLEQARIAYGQQLAQYVVGSDRRCGVLAVLCRAPEGAAPGSLENDIGMKVVPPPTGGDREVLLGIVLIRGDLPKPSSLSRRS